MKTVHILFAVLAGLIFACLLFVRTAYCGDIKGRWAVGSRYSYVAVDDADFKNNANDYGINLTYGFTNNLALEFEADYFKVESKSDTKLETYSLHANLQLRANFDKFAPYLTAGPGIQYYSYGILKGDDRDDKDYYFSYKLGAGVEYFLDKNWALNLEGAYVYGNTGGRATLDVYGWRYGGGIKYYF